MTMKTFEEVTKKSKRKNLWKTIGLSSLIGFILMLIGVQTVKIIVGAREGREVWEQTMLMEIAYPNINHDGIKIQSTSYVSGKLYFDLYKDLDGVPMAFGQHEIYYDLFDSHYDFAQHIPGNTFKYLYDFTTNTKVPVFYNRKKSVWSVQDIANELHYLKDMSGQLVEVAISFDKKYSLAEIKQMIPSNLKQNWYWIGTEGKQNTHYYRPEQLLGLDPENIQLVFSDMPGDYMTGMDFMKEFLESGDQKRAQYLDIPVDDLQAFVDKFGGTDFTKQEEIDQLEFAGIILTGRAEDFAQLEGKDWIYASSIGASIPIQPYYQLHH
ncbi:TPA: anti sigma factor C-terminal domain-containing protein [Streptococcus suis]|nr:anti sigma factor C-terminal domain-containing protein [Streptococcus suis]